jgi:transposase
VPTSDKQKKQKNDTVGAGKIAKQLSINNLDVVYVPTLAEQNDRTLVRVREQLVADQTRCKNRIRHLLHFNGLKVADGLDKKKYWTLAFIKALEELECRDNSLRITLNLLLAELKDIRKKVLEATTGSTQTVSY